MPTLMRRGPASANPSSGHDDGPPHPSPSDLRRRRSNDGGDGDGDATNHRQHRNLDSDLELELDHRLSNRHRRGGPADREGRRTRTRTRTAPTVGAGRGRRNRVVLLLDLDCFYAQCECVRLGIDSSSVPVVLLQWNSCLAVNYPARSYGIKRGDSFEAVREKSGGRCAALHLPVIPVSGGGGGGDCGLGAGVKSAASVAGNEADDKNDGASSAASSSLDESYAEEYLLPPAVRSSLLLREKNVMRRPSEGKASLERYRVASAMIFRTATEALREHLGKDGFVLERASIDELFLDVSEHCYDESRTAWREEEAATKSSAGGCQNNNGDGEGDVRIGGGRGGGDAGSSIGPETTSKADETVVCGASGSFRLDGDDREDDEDEDVRALRRGCAVALGVRRAVYDRLGFTLSAGVSVNKMMAKLAAGYGKPNGQAVIFPEAIAEVLKDTEIRKVRHFGGKAGKKLLELLPPGETKMGSVAKLLSLNRLVEGLGGRDAARHAFDASRGIDNEEVTETKGALTKSITAFKSFRATTLDGLGRWMALLATDVCERVELDSKRNSRYPKNCNIQYVYLDGRGNRVTRSLRVPFPNKSGAPSSSRPRAEELVRRVTDALRRRGGTSPMNRLGLSAVDFETRATSGTGGIESFFRAGDGRSSGQLAEGGGKKTCAADGSTDREKDDSGVDDGAVDRSRRRLDVAKDRWDGKVTAAPKRRSAPAPSKSGGGELSSGAKKQTMEEPMDKEGRATVTIVAAEDAAAMAPESSPTDTSSNDQRHEQQCRDDMELARRMQERFDKEEEGEEAQRRQESPPPTATSGGSSESPSLSVVPSIAAAADDGVSCGVNAEESSGPLRRNHHVVVNDDEGEESSSVDADPAAAPLESRRRTLDEERRRVQEGSSCAEPDRDTTRDAEASEGKDEDRAPDAKDTKDSIVATDDDRQYRDDMELARKMQERFDKEDGERRRAPLQAAAVRSPSGAAGRDGGMNATVLSLVHPETASSSSDLDYATKLQALYDRENTVLSAHDGRRCRVAATPPTKRALSAAAGHRPPRWNSPKKKNRIENFFSRK